MGSKYLLVRCLDQNGREKAKRPQSFQLGPPGSEGPKGTPADFPMMYLVHVQLLGNQPCIQSGVWPWLQSASGVVSNLLVVCCCFRTIATETAVDRPSTSRTPFFGLFHVLRARVPGALVCTSKPHSLCEMVSTSPP